MTITFNKDAVQINNKSNFYKDFKVGKIDFVVDESEERHSEKLGAYILLKLSISNQEKQLAKTTTCLFFAEHLLWRVKSFCSSVGEDSLFNSGKISADAFIGLEGTALTDRNKEGYINIKKFFPKILKIKESVTAYKNNQDNLEKVIDYDLPF